MRPGGPLNVSALDALARFEGVQGGQVQLARRHTPQKAVLHLDLRLPVHLDP